MEKSSEILSDVIVWSKYSKYLDDKMRRETWQELVTRNKEMHIKKFPHMETTIEAAYEYVYDKRVLPSMRSLQFGGKAIEVNNVRLFNCSFLPVNDYRAFNETMFLLLAGVGVGYSVQSHHVAMLPEIKRASKSKKYVIGDNIEGWADAIKVLMKSYFGLSSWTPKFDYSAIRAKGERLITSGGVAPGPEPLKICIAHIQAILDRYSDGEKLSTLSCHDILCHIANAVLSGGIRRSAMISLFDADDNDMMTCKFGKWYETNPQRGRSNNSAVMVRSEISREQFFDIWSKVEASQSGEPGMYLTDNKELGTNPCCEISLNPFQFCNLVEINASDIKDQSDLMNRTWAASVIGTIQASYTDFHYLRKIWQETTEKEALLGIGMTGIASGIVDKLNLDDAAKYAIDVNIEMASRLKINPAARVTCVKPSGTTSLVLGTSSGIHAWHSDYYIRRVRVGKNEAMYTYLSINNPDMIEDDLIQTETQAVLSVPQKAPDGAITREREDAISFLERIKMFHEKWIKPGHVYGDNTHNVSATVTIKDEEWGKVGQWLWDNKNSYNGLSFLPESLGSYKQTPFESIDKETYESMIGGLHSIDVTKIVEIGDNTNLADNLACFGNNCEIV